MSLFRTAAVGYFVCVGVCSDLNKQMMFEISSMFDEIDLRM